MNYSKIITFSLLALAISACSVDSKKGKGVTQGKANEFKGEGNFRVGSVGGESSQKVNKNSYGITTSKFFNMKACLTTDLGAAVVPDSLFSVNDENGGKISQLATDKKGCIQWQEEHEFNFLATERFYKFNRIIKAESVYKGFVVAELAFNPWSEGNTFLDLRYTQLPENQKLEENKGGISVLGSKINSVEADDFRVHLKNISFNAEKYDYLQYEVNNFLGLTVAHQYEVSFSPLLLIKDINLLEKSIPFKSGNFKVSIALIKENNEDVIGYSEFESEIHTDNEIRKVITFKIPFVADLTSRKRIVVTIEPTEKLGNKKIYSFEAVLPPGKIVGASVAPSQLNAQTLISNQLKLNSESQKNETASSKELLLKTLQIQQLSNDTKHKYCFGFNDGCKDMSFSQVADMLLDSKTNAFDKKYLLKEICKNYLPIEMRSVCLSRKSKEYVNIKPIEIVKKVHGAPKKLGSSVVSTMDFNTSFAISKSESYDTVKGGKLEASIGSEVSLGAGLDESFKPIGGGLKISAGGSIYTSTGFTLSESNSYNSSISSSTGFTVKSEANKFLVDATVERCIVISLTEKATKDVKSNLRAGLICSENFKREKRIETYYLLTREADSGSLISDNQSYQEIGNWSILIRGDQMFQVFSKYISSLNAPLILKQLPEFSFESKEWKEFQMTQEFPGVLSAQ
jgi:hypothetical protein